MFQAFGNHGFSETMVSETMVYDAMVSETMVSVVSENRKLTFNLLTVLLVIRRA